jgi:hypothetical protein
MAKREIKGPAPFWKQDLDTRSCGVNTPPAKAGGFGLRLKAGSIGHPAD